MDPYVYPGTDVLINRRDIRDHQDLRTFEANASSRRVFELGERPRSGSFDAPHLRDIHRYIFQDVYPWAGEIRTVNISRSNQFPYAFPERIQGALATAFGQLRNERYLAGADRSQFTGRAAHYLGEINAVHPFREGNGRTQREFIRQLAQRNGYAIDWSRVSRDQMYEASQRSFEKGDNSGLEAILRTALRPERKKTLDPRIAEIRDKVRERQSARNPDRDSDRER